MKKRGLLFFLLALAIMATSLSACNTLRVDPDGSVVFWEKTIPLKSSR